jgi:hypothetical protein
MTNGEKVEKVFPDGICPFSKSWLDYEYKEPLTKVNQDLTKNDDCISRQAINGYIDYILSHGMGKKKSFDFIKKFVANMSSVTPQKPRKGQWLRMSDLSEQEDDRYKCSCCGNVIHYTNKINLYTFNSWCGRCGSDNGIHIHCEVEE